jgi:hypothetical protein
VQIGQLKAVSIHPPLSHARCHGHFGLGNRVVTMLCLMQRTFGL